MCAGERRPIRRSRFWKRPWEVSPTMAAEQVFVNGMVVSRAASLLENLVSGRLVVGYGVHGMAQGREHEIHPLPGAALIAQRTMFGDAVPRIVGELLFKVDLRRRVELSAAGMRSVATDTRGESFSGHSTALFSMGMQVRIGLQLQANIEFDILLGKRSHHRIAQIVVGRTERQAAVSRVRFFRFRPHRVLHRLSFSQQVRNATEIGSFQRAALRLDPQRLHDEIEHVRAMKVEEVENLRVLQAFDLQLRVRVDVRALRRSAVETPVMSWVNFSSSISFGPGTPISLMLMLMKPTSSMSGVM